MEVRSGSMAALRASEKLAGSTPQMIRLAVELAPKSEELLADEVSAEHFPGALHGTAAHLSRLHPSLRRAKLAGAKQRHFPARDASFFRLHWAIGREARRARLAPAPTPTSICAPHAIRVRERSLRVAQPASVCASPHSWRQAGPADCLGTLGIDHLFCQDRHRWKDVGPRRSVPPSTFSKNASRLAPDGQLDPPPSLIGMRRCCEPLAHNWR